MKEQKGHKPSSRKKNLIILAVLFLLLALVISVSLFLGKTPVKNIAPTPPASNVSQSEMIK